MLTTLRLPGQLCRPWLPMQAPPPPPPPILTYTTPHHTVTPHTLPCSGTSHFPATPQNSSIPFQPTSMDQAPLRPDTHVFLPTSNASPQAVIVRPTGPINPSRALELRGWGSHGASANSGGNPIQHPIRSSFGTAAASLPSFSGEQPDRGGENFNEWLERLELVASACKWDDQAKLVNVATRLRGPASQFYQSCTPQQGPTTVSSPMCCARGSLLSRYSPSRAAGSMRGSRDQPNQWITMLRSSRGSSTKHPRAASMMAEEQRQWGRVSYATSL